MTRLVRMLSPILIVVILLALTVSVGAQGNISVNKIQVKPESPAEDQKITISVEATNDGTEEFTDTVTLMIDGQEAGKQDVTLAAGKSKTITFEAQAGATGQHVIDINGLQGEFETGGASTAPTASTGSFWSLFPSYVWGIIGAILAVLILLVIVLTVVPAGKKRRAAGAGQAARTASPPASGAMPMPMPMAGPTPGQASDVRQPRYPTTMLPQVPGAFPPQEQFQAPQPFPTPMPFPEPAPSGGPFPQYARRPIFSLSNLTITPNHVKANQPVTVTVMVSNNGAESGKYSVVLRINGVVENIIELALPPGVSQAISFNVIKEIGGSYYAEVDGLGGEFAVVPLVPANFSVTDLIIAPERVKQGESVNISVVATNHGEVSGDHVISLYLKGTEEGVQEVSLGPGESQRVDFNVIKTAPGFYNVEVEGLSGRFVVEMEWQDTLKI